MPYISVTIPAHTAFGQTVDATIGNKRARVTVIAEGLLRIEPDDLCTIVTATSEDGRTTIGAISGRTR